MLAVLLFAIGTLVPGTNGTYTDGVYTWAGNPFCAEIGTLLSPESPAIDHGAPIAGFHCPAAGPFPGSDCVEWYGLAPDIGACEFVPTSGFPGPSGLVVVVK